MIEAGNSPDAAHRGPRAPDGSEGGNTGALHFTTVEMVKTPGFPRGLAPIDGLSAGINLIFGPNGAGKTTMARSLMGLLWPGTAPAAMELNGQFTADGSRWHVHAARGRGRWQREGSEETVGPVLVSATEADRYYLSLTELLQAEESGGRFARQIEKETAGGYDMTAMREDFRRRWHVSGHQVAARRLKEARGQRDKALQKMMELDAKDQELARKLEDRDRARGAARRLHLIDAALRALQARRERDRLKGELTAFPPWMDQLTGSEGQRLEEIDGLLADSGTEARAEQNRMEAAEAKIRELGLPEEGLAPGLLEAWRGRIDDLRRQEEEIHRAGPDLARARQTVADIEASFGGTIDPAGVKQIGRREIDELARLARDVRTLDGREAALAAQVAALEERSSPAAADEDIFHQGLTLLSRWLRQPGEDAPEETPAVSWPGLAGAILMAVGGAAMVIGGITGWGTAFLAAGLVIGGFIFLQSRSRSPSEPAGGGRRREQEEFLNLGVEPTPREWSEEGVAAAVAELERALRQTAAAGETERNLQALRPQLEEVRRNLAEAAAGWAEYAAELGLPADADPASLEVLAATIKEWQGAHRNVGSLTASLEEAEKKLKDGLASLNMEFEKLGMPPAEDRARAAGIYEAVREKADEWQRARGEIASARGALKRIRDTADRAREERDEIFGRLGLDAGEGKDEAELLQALERLQEFRRLQQDYYAADQAAHRRLQELTEAGGEASLLESGEESLQELRESASREAERLEEIMRHIGELSNALEEAKKGNTVEKALALVEERERELRDLYHQGLRLKLGVMMADAVIEKTRQEERPHVFYRARDLFSAFTDGGYELTMDDEGDTFRAVEGRTGQGRALDELSDATKVQLLMAVRMAFVEQYENGLKLPIIFDEVLATSDDNRARALMETVIALAAAGRQIFYFTAQHEEIGRWRSLLEKDLRAPWTYITLGNNEGNGGADAYE